jgi:hypothetical protein
LPEPESVPVSDTWISRDKAMGPSGAIQAATTAAEISQVLSVMLFVSAMVWFLKRARPLYRVQQHCDTITVAAYEAWFINMQRSG